MTEREVVKGITTYTKQKINHYIQKILGKFKKKWSKKFGLDPLPQVWSITKLLVIFLSLSLVACCNKYKCTLSQ